MRDRLDIIVFGATGFTGKCTLPKVYELGKAEGRNLSWGIAGRSEQKLKNVLIETAKRIGVNSLSSVPIIVADVTNEESIKKMAAQAKLIINCCGPYKLYGEVVIKSCIESGTHHLDLSIETQFIERMQLKYHKAAEEKGLYIVSACGVSSIPTEMGLIFLENKFKGTLNSAELYFDVYQNDGRNSAVYAHYGTFASIIHMVADYEEVKLQRKKLYPNPLPKFQPQLSWRFPLRKIYNKWALPCPILEEDIIRRSQLYFYKKDKKRPINVHCYIMVHSFILALACLFGAIFVLILLQFNWGKTFVLKYPRVFSVGFSSHNPPEDIESSRFAYTLYCEGWNETLAGDQYQYKKHPNKAIVGRVTGVNPGYGFTCIAIMLCAVMILTEPKKLPAKGGVYTTATAFSKTSLIEQLQKNGTNFELISVKDL